MKRNYIHYAFFILIFWIIFIIFILFGELKDYPILYNFDELFIYKFSDDKDFLDNFFYKNDKAIHFYNLPKRKFGITFSEVTSANRDGRHSLASDFTFFVAYGEDTVTLIDDKGCGCILRIYIYPPLPTDMSLYKLTPADLNSMFIQINVDNFQYEYSLKDMAEADTFPFLYPLSSRFSLLVSGISSYSPICYNRSILIRYKHNRAFPKDLFHTTINCSLNELRCPVKMYSGISLMKYPINQKCPLRPFYHQIHVYERRLQKFANLLNMHSSIEPDQHACIFKCSVLTKRESITIFKSNDAQVINLLRFNIFNLKNMEQFKIWNNVLLTLKTDGAVIPNIYKVPLSAIFGSRNFKGASFGKKLQKCCYQIDSKFDKFCKNFEIGYFLLPIPYWKSAEIILEFSSSINLNISSILVCYQINSIKNDYDPISTASLSISRKYFGGDVSKTREFFKVDKAWGHIVGILIEIENLLPHLDGPPAATWAALQSDLLIFVDGMRTPVAIGTGLEDYFSYAHGFANAENTSFSFVGIHHSADEGKQEFRKPSAITRHCYRQHILDPITYNSKIRVVMEGMDDKLRYELEDEIILNRFEEMKTKGEECFAYTVIYYSKQSNKNNHSASNFNDTDDFIIKNRKEITKVSKLNKNCVNFLLCDKKDNKDINSRQMLNYSKAKYIGDVISSRHYNGCSVSINNGTRLQIFITLPYITFSQLVVLIRTSYCIPFQRSSLSQISINKQAPSEWSFQTGCLNSEYSLIEQSLNIKANKLQNFSIDIFQLTDIIDISYRLCEVPSL